MSMYNLIEYRDNYLIKHQGVYGNTIEINQAIADFLADNNNTTSFKLKTKIAGRTKNGGTKDVRFTVP